jgi:hypothetical protein
MADGPTTKQTYALQIFCLNQIKLTKKKDDDIKIWLDSVESLV